MGGKIDPSEKITGKVDIQHDTDKLLPPLKKTATSGFPAIEGDSSFQQPGVLGINYEGGDGVLGQSNTGIGIHGVGNKAGSFAGSFEGDVEITGSLTVPDVNGKKRSFSDLVTQVDAIPNFTFHGLPISPVIVRPSITVTKLTTNSFGTGAFFEAVGRKFPKPRARVVFNIFNVTTQTTLDIPGLDQDPAHEGRISVAQDGTFTTVLGAVYEQDWLIPCKSGDQLTFAASDGSSDGNDITGQLWSNTETKVVP
jgi:hypothetical protein